MSFGSDMPDYSSMYAAQLEDSKLARAEAAEQAQLDQIFAREQAEIERKALDERLSASTTRTKQEEQSRIKNLSAAESDATDEAEEIMESQTADRDTNYSNMFASLLRGALGGGGAQQSTLGRGLRGMRNPISRSGTKR
jgi:hypothetical protein